MGPKSPTPQTQQFFGYPLDQHLNLKHPLIQLTALIDWSEIDKTFSGHFVSDRSRPALPPRLVAGLLYLQHTFDCSDELVVNTLGGEPVLAILHGRELFANPLPKTVIVDKGYQGVKIEGVEILRSGQRRVTRAMKVMIKRRSAIEPAIGHMKMDGKLSRNPLKGALGDALHAVMCGAGHNMRVLLRKLKLLCAQFGLNLQTVLQAISPSQRTNYGGVV